MPMGSVTIGSAFLPTPSARRATRKVGHCGRDRAISTHALREEGDMVYINRDVIYGIIFLPTPSARRATPHRSHL